MKLRVEKLVERRQQAYKKGFQLGIEYNYSMALEELHQAYSSGDKLLLEEAFNHVAFALHHSDLDSAFKKIDQFIYPEVRRLIKNLHRWYELFNSDKYLLDLILEIGHLLLNVDLDDYIEQQNSHCKVLQRVSGVPFKFNGIILVANELCDEKTVPRKIFKKIMEVLIARGILNGGSNQNADYLFECIIIDIDRLEQVDGKQLVKEIDQASALIAQITGKPCQNLWLYPVDDSMYYQPLEQLGAFKVRDYNAFDVVICDFNLQVLERLNAENLTMTDLWRLDDSSIKPKKPIEISFHIGHHDVNTISFYHIPSMEMVESIKAITRQSSFSVNAFGIDESTPLQFSKGDHLLRLYLPMHGGGFEYSFKQDNYRQWKGMILQLCPELASPFVEFEEKASKTECLYQIQQELQSYSHGRGMYFLNKSQIADLEKQKEQLTEALYGPRLFERASRQKKEKDTFCGFEPGFLLGKF